MEFDPRNMGRRAEFDSTGSGQLSCRFDDIQHDTFQLECGVDRQRPACVGAGQEEKVLYQDCGAGGLFHDLRQSIPVLVRLPGTQRYFGGGADQRQRRAKFVRGIGCKLRDLLEGGFQAREHVVQGLG